MVHVERNRMPESSLAVIGCPITVRADQCLALPLPLHASDPGTATTLLHVQGIAYGSLSGAAPFSVFVLQVNHTFHQENWSIFTFNGGCQDIIPIVVPTVPTIYSGEFTDVWQLRLKKIQRKTKEAHAKSKEAHERLKKGSKGK